MNIPKTGVRKFEAKLSIVKISRDLKERLDALKGDGENTEADIVRAALDKFLPKKTTQKEGQS